MSAMRNSLFALVLLAVAAGGATSAAASDRGIWVDPQALYSAWTLTVLNLTDRPLLLTNDVTASAGQRPPFNGIPACSDADPDYRCAPVAPYRSVTWKSDVATALHPYPRWNGTLSILPKGIDEKWAVTVNFMESPDKATWVYMTVDFAGNDGWLDYDPDNPSCGYLDYYTESYNVMKVSGTDLVAILYAPYVAYYGSPIVDATLILQQRGAFEQIPGYDGTYEDERVAPCVIYQDNNRPLP